MQKNSQISGLLALALACVCSAQTACTASVYSQIAHCVASSTAITLSNIYAPPSSSIDLTKVKAGTTITFVGKTTFGFTNDSSFDPIKLGGSGITITAKSGAVIDGNGQAYWDGLGSNGGVPKPNHFIAVSKLIGGSVIENLYIQNWPVHLFSISGAAGLTIQNLVLNNTAGDAPNAASGKLAAAHNSDGFDLSSSTDTIIKNTSVYNQDDCVAVTSGNNITIDGVYCYGGHGLSIGSVGGKSNNNVTNITFKNSQLVNSSNGARIKSNYNTTGFISNITYSNIKLTNIDTYGIDVQQDYLNGGPTGNPSNGVIIQNILFQNVVGTAAASAKNYYVLCGSGSCSNISFSGVKITGGALTSSCNYPSTGCPALMSSYETKDYNRQWVSVDPPSSISTQKDQKIPAVSTQFSLRS
ncbi:Polygalacturonase 6 [Sclerotinia borealis F-4128]|uniref:endo-polygalacturonase n=1 Tax=Sclerotinia borealis (strain F-4128) TaxID=1432307 RepID=W9CQ92_SCLBF|nr:Polygalacturonase 6 [Sclerotinia borealis F-4128]